MELVVSSKSHEQDPYVRFPLTDDEVLELSLEFFDKDGYEITRLEQEYLLAHNWCDRRHWAGDRTAS